MRKEGDSNPRYAFDVYTLSRRASSTTRASFLELRSIAIRVASYNFFCKATLYSTAKVTFFFKSLYFSQKMIVPNLRKCKI